MISAQREADIRQQVRAETRETRQEIQRYLDRREEQRIRADERRRIRERPCSQRREKNPATSSPNAPSIRARGTKTTTVARPVERTLTILDYAQSYAKRRHLVAELCESADVAAIDAMIDADPEAHLPRIAGILRLAKHIGLSPESRSALRTALVDPNGTKGTASLQYLNSGEERRRRRTVDAMLGRGRYEAPDALDHFTGDVMTPPSAAELLATTIRALR